MSSDTSGKGLLLKSDKIASVFQEEIRRVLKERTRAPKLVGILSTSAKPSAFYAEFTRKQCEEYGVEFVLKKTGAALASELAEGDGAEEAIIEANQDESVDGIMVSRTCKRLTFLINSRFIILYSAYNR
jgi:methylenetetrahydrofolate dehydrogenase (NAD+)